MSKNNLKSIIVGLLVLLAGFALVVYDVYVGKTETAVWISIGCSLIASALVILLNVFLVDEKEADPLEAWKLCKIYETRAEKNADTSNYELDHAKYQLDAIAFGLKSFRVQQEKRVIACLMRGVNIRIITMNPASPFVAEREKEENEAPGQIKNTIEQLIEWANDLNSMNYKGKIIIKGYSCMTLDFYWRVDNSLYVGPYLYGIDSQQTITYSFASGGKGFQKYTEYFEKIWNNSMLLSKLV